MTLDDLRRIQQIDTEMLFHIVDICEKFNIQYVLFYGTLLGAVRHGGPIPWDDDVDIAMTRENYMKFLKVAKTEIDYTKYNLRIMGSGSPDYISEIKIGRKNTLYCMPGSEDFDICKNIQLDIFLLDYVKKMCRKKMLLYNKIREILMLTKLNWSEKKLLFFCLDSGGRGMKWLYKLGLILMHVLRYVVGEKNIEHFLYLMFVDITGKSDRMGVVHMSTRKLFDASDMNNPEMLQYDGRLFSVPRNYEKVLTIQYGDYMKYPPEAERLKRGFDTWICEFDKD